jgi:hypothetical protein
MIFFEENPIARLVKISQSGQEVSAMEVLPIDTEVLEIGGAEGKKYHLRFNNPRLTDQRADRNLPETLQLFLKEHHETRTPEYMRSLVAFYAKLRNKGYPVPKTVRLIEYGGKSYLAMSDISENGKYLVWGYSDDMTDHQYDDLKEMNLTPEEIQTIAGSVTHICERATQDDVEVYAHLFHIRKEKSTGKVDVMLLDLAVPSAFKVSRLALFNKIAGQIFIETQIPESLEYIKNNKQNAVKT